MAFNGQNKENIDQQQLGAFTGYIRRPTPNTYGMTAQIFGENGEDADTILALSLTKYQDAKVSVAIFLIKDADGKLMKESDGYPLISSFDGFIRRSLPKKEGMIAQFFAPNGVDADSISILSKSCYQDSLVFVDVKGINCPTEETFNEVIDSKYSSKLTKTEKKELADREKEFTKTNSLLEYSQFLYSQEVALAISTPSEFKKWIEETQPCCSSHPCLNQSITQEIDFIIKPFNFLPLCESHNILSEEHLKTTQSYYEMKHRLLLKNFIWDNLVVKFSDPLIKSPNPQKIIDWAKLNNLHRLLPSKYIL